MSFLDAVLLGIIQGLSEFLPVSSSGHLVMGETLLGVHSPGVVLEVVLHVATVLSVVIVYRATLLRLLLGALARDPAALRYIALLALASVPAAIVGLGFEDAIESAFDTPAVTGAMLLVTGVLLWSTRRFVGAERAPRDLDWRVALVMGCAQAFAILPGISRSGTTITAGLWSRLDGERAAEFSFLMSLPAIGGAALLQLGEFGESVRRTGGPELAAGFIAALLFGIVAIRSLVWLLRHQRFHVFAYYLWPVGTLFLLFLWSRS